MIKDKINPQLRKRFLQEIKETKSAGLERGFHICIEDDDKLSAGTTCIGKECGLKFENVELTCPGKRVQGDFHTHPYKADIKKEFGITFKPSKELMKSATETFLEERGIESTTPSQADVLSAILGKCSKRTKGTTCIGTDLEDKKIECWTIKEDLLNKPDDQNCVKAFVEHFHDEIEVPPKEWTKPLFDVEKITLKQ